jgi:alkanesulfonate monooxygenase SsuD/methylene tetrahydromethanopterin reductase-like flavin-dependent oxidoreductase (luciferase family)
MKYGFVLPFGDARTVAELATLAEDAGWDGFFTYEAAWGIDAWVSLAAAAMTTSRIRLGTMLSPVSRMRPWKLASETATVDNLSGGRVILSVGLGAIETGFEQFGEVTDRKTRAELVDECLEIVTGLWRGQPFSFEGKHYHVKECDFMPPPPPVQQPRIPIWVVGLWPRRKSMARALRYDGIIPSSFGEDGGARQATPDEVRQIRAFADRERAGAPLDVVVEGTTTPGGDVSAVREWADAGATWFNEAMWDAMGTPDGAERVRARIAAGPPRVD